MAETLNQTDLRALDSCRRQLVQLTQTLRALNQAIALSSTLPSLESLNIQSELVKNNIRNILTLLNPENPDRPSISEQIVAYPSTNFPGRDVNKEEVLRMLLRKKVEPDVEAWVAEGRKTGEESERIGLGVGGEGEEEGGDVGEDITVAWKEIKEWFDERVSRYAAEETCTFTAEEQARGTEHVNTGNKRDYEEHNDSEGDDDDDEDEDEDDDDDDDDDDEGEAARKKWHDGTAAEQRSLEDILRFWTTGQAEARRQDNSHMHRRR